MAFFVKLEEGIGFCKVELKKIEHDFPDEEGGLSVEYEFVVSNEKPWVYKATPRKFSISLKLKKRKMYLYNYKDNVAGTNTTVIKVVSDQLYAAEHHIVDFCENIIVEEVKCRMEKVMTRQDTLKKEIVRLNIALDTLFGE